MAALLSISVAISQHQLIQRGHGYRASSSRGVPIYIPNFASTILYCLVTAGRKVTYWQGYQGVNNLPSHHAAAPQPAVSPTLNHLHHHATYKRKQEQFNIVFLRKTQQPLCRLSRVNLKHFYLPNPSHQFNSLLEICVPCPRSYCI